MLALRALIAVAVLVAMACLYKGFRPWGLMALGLLALLVGLRGVPHPSPPPLCRAVAWAGQDREVPAGDAAKSPERKPGSGGKVPAKKSRSRAGDEGASPDQTPPQKDADAEALSPELRAEKPIEPVTHVTYATKNRPDWLESGMLVDGEVQRVAVKAGPYYRMRECLRELDEEIRAAAEEFINDYLEDPRAATLVRYDLRQIKNRLVRETFQEQLDTSVGPMNQAHALLEFDTSFCSELEERWKRAQTTVRLWHTGALAGIVLLLIATLFAYVQLDTATKGHYTGRLQFAAAAAILALVAAGVLVTRWIPWM